MVLKCMANARLDCDDLFFSKSSTSFTFYKIFIVTHLCICLKVMHLEYLY